MSDFSASFHCPPCRGLGRFPPRSGRADDFPVACVKCAGQGRWELGQLARLIEEDPRRIENVIEGVARAATCARVFEKVCAMFPDV